MRNILAASVFSVSLAAHSASGPLEPVRVQLQTDNPDPVKGDQEGCSAGS